MERKNMGQNEDKEQDDRIKHNSIPSDVCEPWLKIYPRPQMTADPHTLHCAAETEPAKPQSPMCLGTEQHQKFIWNSKLEDFNHTKYVLCL